MHKIADYGFIGNTRTGCLVSKDGSIDWCCFPRFDSPSYFGALLDSKKGGHFQISPREPFFSNQSYIEDTNVLETTFHNETGTVRLLDCFPVASEKDKRGTLWPFHEVLRVVEGVEGCIRFSFSYFPRPNYAQGACKLFAREVGSVYCNAGNELLSLKTSLPSSKIEIFHEQHAFANFEVKKGERYIFSMCFSTTAPAVIPALGNEAMKRLNHTIAYWREWISCCKYHGPYKKQVIRSALTLKLLTFAPSGAVLAAPTTSLPELIGGVRNWDYRYCWLRDASLTVRSLVTLGFDQEAAAFINWILHTTHLSRPRLKVLYDVYGEPKIPEKILSWFSGFFHSKPVRIGNAADNQFQLDVYGEVLDAIYYYAPEAKEFDQETINFLRDMGSSVCEVWREPDEGIWEIRSGRSHHTHSKVMAWVAFDRLIKLSNQYKWNFPIKHYTEIGNRIIMSIENHGFNKKVGAYTRYFGSEELDASVLVMPLVGYCPSNSPRMMSTIQAIKEKLTHNGLLYRYLGEDGLPGLEGAFGICNFWMVESLAKQGKTEEAHQWFTNFINRTNSLHLWPEEIDPVSNEFLGNYPQAFTHARLISAALALEQKS
jgi:GH15 family glucan-1,4-alpha-glucosidase